MVDTSIGALVERLEAEISGSSNAKRMRICSDTSQVQQSQAAASSSFKFDVNTYRAPGLKLLQAKVDQAVVSLFCVAGLPPSIVDSKEWKNLLSVANSSIRPMSSSTLEDSHIPGEAARIRTLSIKYLKTVFDLTITFDGGTTQAQQSVYTIHFTTPDGRSFLIEGNEASGASHTGEHIAALILTAMDMVGRTHFSAIASDNTGNTRSCRRLVCNEVATLINMLDCVHHMSLVCKDLSKLPIFADVSSDTFFSLVTYVYSHVYDR